MKLSAQGPGHQLVDPLLHRWRQVDLRQALPLRQGLRRIDAHLSSPGDEVGDVRGYLAASSRGIDMERETGFKPATTCLEGLALDTLCR